jgi:hypothetical protein
MGGCCGLGDRSAGLVTRWLLSSYRGHDALPAALPSRRAAPAAALGGTVSPSLTVLLKEARQLVHALGLGSERLLQDGTRARRTPTLWSTHEPAVHGCARPCVGPQRVEALARRSAQRLALRWGSLLPLAEFDARRRRRPRLTTCHKASGCNHEDFGGGSHPVCARSPRIGPTSAACGAASCVA